MLVGLDVFSRIITVEFDGKPVGLFLLMDRGWIVEPHAEWFPWATARQKIEASVKLLDDIRKTPWMGDYGPEH